MTAGTKDAAYRPYREVIEGAIADWLKDQPKPLAIPIDPEAIGDLSLRITKALEDEWLIDPLPVSRRHSAPTKA